MEEVLRFGLVFAAMVFSGWRTLPRKEEAPSLELVQYHLRTAAIAWAIWLVAVIVDVVAPIDTLVHSDRFALAMGPEFVGDAEFEHAVERALEVNKAASQRHWWADQSLFTALIGSLAFVTPVEWSFRHLRALRNDDASS